ncbi:hypothetical protein Calle1_59 [Cellulophaga phage Calle_1]|uniref:Uncharacterized protein n=1 Tax=Cellulophaga phage Calle_1 TaxID=2745643 RepID=A0A8E5EAF1_9CAUD|nr:hypothetical protein M1M22_gp056 [Cellulophaga phage Calle_1]QQV89756.1 hypothetical protein Calle1_59 [Cellulophaga phage Calle_1]QQV89833.1 hypothetical protein Calle2_59 [Cellulophaga phage Calle_2]QQV89886.1 hypothetical protein Calle3_59 [Cellulophaga phage Calle_3]
MEYRKGKVVMLPTEGKSQIVAHMNSKNLYYYDNVREANEKRQYTNQDLYITVDEEIKEGSSVLYNKTEVLQVQMVTKESYHFTNGEYEMKTNIFSLDKIISSTNKSLGLPSTPQSFVKDYCKIGGIDEVLVEYENFCTSEVNQHPNPKLRQRVVCHNCSEDCNLILNIDPVHNTITILEVKQSYSIQEVLDLIELHGEGKIRQLYGR